MELKITYVLYLNSLDIISEHKTKFKIKSVLSTQKNLYENARDEANTV